MMDHDEAVLVLRLVTRNAPRMNGWMRQKYV